MISGLRETFLSAVPVANGVCLGSGVKVDTDAGAAGTFPESGIKPIALIKS
jgi:hypothetical protein